MFLKDFFILACFSAFNTAVRRASSHGKGFRCPTEELTAGRGDAARGLLASQKAAKNLSSFSVLSWPLPSAEGIKPESKSVIPKPSFGTTRMSVTVLRRVQNSQNTLFSFTVFFKIKYAPRLT